MHSDTFTIMTVFSSLIGFLTMALGIFLILAAFCKKGCGWLVFGVVAIILAMACASFCFPAVIAGGVFGALLFAVVYFLKEEND